MSAGESPVSNFKVLLQDIEWHPVARTREAYKYDVVLLDHSLYGNAAYPQHAATFKIRNLGNLPMKDVSIFGLVQDHEGNVVDILAPSAHKDLASEEMTVTTIRSLSSSGRCVGPASRQGYLLHYWLEFKGKKKQQMTHYYPSATSTPPMHTDPHSTQGHATSFTRKLYRKSGRCMRGEDVTQLQKKLIAMGYTEVGTADGCFGPKTESGVKHFQADHDLPETGIVDERTWDLLFSSSLP